MAHIVKLVFNLFTNQGSRKVPNFLCEAIEPLSLGQLCISIAPCVARDNLNIVNGSLLLFRPSNKRNTPNHDLQVSSLNPRNSVIFSSFRSILWLKSVPNISSTHPFDQNIWASLSEGKTSEKLGEGITNTNPKYKRSKCTSAVDPATIIPRARDVETPQSWKL